MSGPMSLREARTKQQKEKSYKNSRLRFRASMKPTRNDRSPSEHGDEKSTRRKKIMKVENTEGEGSTPNVGESESEELKIAVSSAGDIDMSGGSGEIVEKEGTSANPDEKDTGDTESDTMSIEKALEIVCGEAEAEDKQPATEDEASEDSLMPDEGKKGGSSTTTDESGLKKSLETGDKAVESSEKKPKQEKVAGIDMPLFKDEDDEKGNADKKKKSRKDDDDPDEDDSEDVKKAEKEKEKEKEKDKDGDGSGGSDKPDGGDGKDKDDDASGGDKPAGGESKDDDDKDGADNEKGGTGGQNSDDDFDMGGNGDGDKNISDDDLDDLGGSSEDGASDDEASEVEETENTVEGESEFETTDDEESEADSAVGKGLGELNVTEEGIGGIIFDREARGGNRAEFKPTTTEEVEKTNESNIAAPMNPYDYDVDYEDEPDAYNPADDDYWDYLSGGSGGDDDHSFVGDDDYLEDAEEVRGTG